MFSCNTENGANSIPCKFKTVFYLLFMNSIDDVIRTFELHLIYEGNIKQDNISARQNEHAFWRCNSCLDWQELLRLKTQLAYSCLSCLHGHVDTINKRWHPFCKPEKNNNYDENVAAVLHYNEIQPRICWPRSSLLLGNVSFASKSQHRSMC